MKEKAVFLSDSRERVASVYDSNVEIMQKLTSELEFLPEVINLNNIEKFRDFTNECRYIFSTWGMLALKENDIAKYFNKCEVVFYGAGSVQYFAREYLKRGIKISSSWVENGVPVAEFAVSQILLSCKGYFRIAGKVKKPEDWWKMSRDNGENYKGNYNSKIGILGAGTIGKRIISYLKN